MVTVVFDKEMTKASIALLELCKTRTLTLATAESCTGGLLAAALTDIAGSSAVVERGFVTYSNDAKQQMLGVPPMTIERYGAVSQETAESVARMMRLAVERGTGTAAQIPGWSIGGKTGTGETGVPGANTTWFIAFASRDEETPAELAIAVVLENQAGTGGVTAAPIAKAVMEVILRGTENP